MRVRRFVFAVIAACCIALVLGRDPAAVAAAPLPDREATPGVADPAYDPVASGACAPVTTTSASATSVPKPIAKLVWHAYDIAPSKRKRFELNLLVPAALGGRVDTANVWPVAKRHAAVKDAAEASVLAHVCAGEIPADAARQLLTADWTTAAVTADLVAGAHNAFLADLEHARITEELLAVWQHAAEAEAATRAVASAQNIGSPDASVDATPPVAEPAPDGTPPVEWRPRRLIVICLKTPELAATEAALGPPYGPARIVDPGLAGCPPGYATG